MGGWIEKEDEVWDNDDRKQDVLADQAGLFPMFEDEETRKDERRQKVAVGRGRRCALIEALRKKNRRRRNIWRRF
jgi:hypothetical protein